MNESEIDIIDENTKKYIPPKNFTERIDSCYHNIYQYLSKYPEIKILKNKYELHLLLNCTIMKMIHKYTVDRIYISKVFGIVIYNDRYDGVIVSKTFLENIYLLLLMISFTILGYRVTQ